jgi:GDP-mannose 6-dehydrogenase
MKISVFGLGYVGTVCAACLARRGHSVIGVDKAELKVRLVNDGHSPIVERDIADLIKSARDSGSLAATSDASEAVATTDFSMICVGTPSRANGSLSLESVEKVTDEIGEAISRKRTRHTVVVRSTILPGTTRDIIAPRLAKSSGKAPGVDIGLAFNPEFLREGSAVADFESPPKTIVGAIDQATAEEVMSLYDDLPGEKITTRIETAELAKYVDNAWHALKVAFGNEIGIISKTLGIDSHEVMNIFFADRRSNISSLYLRPGFAFGGSCLPKDLRALTYLGRQLDLRLPILERVADSNQMVIERGLDWILTHGRRRIAFLGISFKAGTDDVRESPYVDLVERLVGKGHEVRIFDPNVRLGHLVGANREFLMNALPHIASLLVETIEQATEWAEAVVVTAGDPIYASAVTNLRDNQIVLDFARLPDANKNTPPLQGFLW